jgi:carbon monoxide dehydrogenase subunit G
MQASATTDINRPIADVFAYVTDPTTMETWVEGVSDVRVGDDPTAVGARFESAYTYGGRTRRTEYEVTAFEPPTRYAMRGAGPFPFASELTLADLGDGRTRVRNTIDASSDGLFTSVMFTVFRPVVRRLMARRLREELAVLQSALEGEAAPEMVA